MPASFANSQFLRVVKAQLAFAQALLSTCRSRFLQVAVCDRQDAYIHAKLTADSSIVSTRGSGKRAKTLLLLPPTTVFN
jgi:hypothetical protein